MLRVGKQDYNRCKYSVNKNIACCLSEHLVECPTLAYPSHLVPRFDMQEIYDETKYHIGARKAKLEKHHNDCYGDKSHIEIFGIFLSYHHNQGVLTRMAVVFYVPIVIYKQKAVYDQSCGYAQIPREKPERLRIEN